MTATGDLSEHFDSSEFRCRCGCGICNVSADLVERLERLRRQVGHALTISSGCRCPAHNAAVGGVKDSAHVTTETEPCEAVDVRIGSGGEAFQILDAALMYSLFNRIGVGTHLVHLDVDPTKPQRTVWVYTDK